MPPRSQTVVRLLPRTALAGVLLLSLASLALPANAAPPEHWVGTWGASPLGSNNADGRLVPVNTAITLREIVRVSLGGSTVRVIFTNELGLDDLTIGAANIALSAGKSEIGTGVAITFAGSPSVTIPPGALMFSDPISLKLPALADVAVSLYLPDQPIRVVTNHQLALQTSYAAKGNVIATATLDGAREIYNWPFVKGIDVKAGADAGAIVTIGDSITDGAQSTRNANARWPSILAARLQANKKTAQFAVLNESISGNRILHENAGPNALARFDRDILAQSGVKYLIFLESINDIGNSTSPTKREGDATADKLIAALSQMAERAHTHGIKVIGGTLTPYVGAKYQSPEGEAMRLAVNQWIRTTKELDGVIDFEKATRDPANPTVFSAAADSGDHLHPADEGYKIMGDAIDLKLFESK